MSAAATPMKLETASDPKDEAARAPYPIARIPNAPPLEAGLLHHRSDLGNVQRFARDHRGCLCYVHGLGWYAFTQGVWRPDTTGAVMRAARETVTKIYLETGRAANEDERKAIAQWALTSEGEPRQRAMVTLARSHEDLAVDPSALDANPWLLNCRNGTIDLRTGRLSPHRPSDFLTKITSAPYVPDAVSALWQQVLDQALPDGAVREYLQQVAGYTACGAKGADIFVLLHGPTRTSKGTVQQGLASALGDYAITAELDLLAERDRAGGPRPELVRLRGARMVSIYETERRLTLSAALVKTLTGGDPITARDLHAKPITFTPQCTLWLATNYRPHAPADDAALWERVREVPFLQHVPEERRDPTIRGRLQDPSHAGSAVLAWIVRGCLAWQQHRVLATPSTVRGATAAYRDQQNPMTHLRRYLADCCEVSTDAWTLTAAFRDDYPAWAADHAAPAKISDEIWTQALREIGCTPERKHAGRGWRGVRLRDTPDLPGVTP